MIKKFDWKKYLKECMASTEFLALSTLSNGKTWTCPVWFAFDENFNLYFISQPNSKHMKNIKQNENISLAIYSTKFNSDDDVYGIQLKGKAKILPDEEIENAYNHYYRRKYTKTNKDLDTSPKDYKGPSATWKFVKIEPTEIHYFDTRFFEEERQTVPGEVFKK